MDDGHGFNSPFRVITIPQWPSDICPRCWRAARREEIKEDRQFLEFVTAPSSPTALSPPTAPSTPSPPPKNKKKRSRVARAFKNLSSPIRKMFNALPPCVRPFDECPEVFGGKAIIKATK